MPLVDDEACALVLYTNPWSRGQIARWMLEETGQPYRHVILGYGDTMKAPAYLQLNPMGKVPTVVHEGRVVTECAAICAYLADAFPDAGLAPTLNDRADYYRWMFFAAGPVEAAVVNRVLKVEVSEAQRRMVGYGSYELAVDTLAQAVSRQPFVAGERFTAADVYVGSQVIWGLQFKTLPERAEFRAYADRLTARQAYQVASRIDAELGQAMSPSTQQAAS
jgi:glutathione S-transferase